MTIVYTTGYLARAGGTERVLTSMAVTAKMNGYRVIVLLRWPLAYPNPYEKDLRSNDIVVRMPPRSVLTAMRMLLWSVTAIGMVLLPLYMLYKRCGCAQASKRLWAELRYVFLEGVTGRYLSCWLSRTLDKMHRQSQIALIHGHRCDRAMPVVAAWAEQNGVPMICHVHSGMNDADAGARRGAWPYTEEQIAIMRRHCHILTLSPLLIPRVVDALGEHTRVSALPNWIPDRGVGREGRQCSATCVFATVSRLVPRKGLEIFVEAMGIVSRRVKESAAIVVGDGPLMGELQRRAQSSQARIQFAGQLTPTEVQNLIGAKADVFVFASEDEGLPMSIIEAMASGLPIIATSVGAVPDLVCNADNGYLIPVGDMSALTEAMTELATDPTRRCRMGAASRERYLSYFSEQAVWPKLHALYQELIAGTGTGT
jgi:glycosyltransferase involved in cell wall biosynthesis